jgi:hypothetical protein
MKEIIEFKIKENDFTQQLQSGDKLYFSPAVSTGLFNHIGIIKDKVVERCVVESQLFYENVSYNYIGQATQVNIYRKFKREEAISTGSIVSRYFEQVEKGDWKIEQELSEDNSKSITANILLSEKEKSFIEFGLKPLSMDDKWFLYFTNTKLHGIRSWTGQEVFQCHFEARDTQWVINKIQISDDWNETIEVKKSIIESLIKARLTVMKNLDLD